MYMYIIMYIKINYVTPTIIHIAPTKKRVI